MTPQAGHGPPPRENREARIPFPSTSNPFCLEATQTRAASALPSAKYYDRCFPVLGKNTCKLTCAFPNNLAHFLKSAAQSPGEGCTSENLVLTK